MSTPSVKTIQLRRYQLDPATFQAWIDWWRTVMVPARYAYGFRVETAFVARDTNEFVWAVSAPVERAAFETMLAEWDVSSERNATMTLMPSRPLGVQTDIVEEP